MTPWYGYTVCYGVPKSNTVPIPTLSILETLQVYPYLCSTLIAYEPLLCGQKCDANTCQNIFKFFINCMSFSVRSFLLLWWGQIFGLVFFVSEFARGCLHMMDGRTFISSAVCCQSFRNGIVLYIQMQPKSSTDCLWSVKAGKIHWWSEDTARSVIIVGGMTHWVLWWCINAIGRIHVNDLRCVAKLQQYKIICFMTQLLNFGWIVGHVQTCMYTENDYLLCYFSCLQETSTLMVPDRSDHRLVEFSCNYV